MFALGQTFDYPVQYPRHEAALRGVGASGPNAEFAAGLVGKDGLSFKDIADSINPLQQLPVIGSIYRATSGDTISAISRLAGGALLGGPVGLLAAAAGSVFEALTGDDIGGHVMTALGMNEAGTAKYATGAYAKAKALS